MDAHPRRHARQATHSSSSTPLMCGIFASLSRHDPIHPDPTIAALLRNRGPDSQQTLERSVNQCHLVLHATVLALRGTSIVSQPLLDRDSGSVLCWNGEAWEIDRQPVLGNDSEAVLGLFVDACRHQTTIASAISRVRGPYAFVFYDAPRRRLYFGRDCLGRRSLLCSEKAGSMILSSICDYKVSDQWHEVEANGIFFVDLDDAESQINCIPYVRDTKMQDGDILTLPYPRLNMTLPENKPPQLSQDSQAVADIQNVLERSLRLRLQFETELFGQPNDRRANIAILFSGGLDCTLLARIAHDILPLETSIDLLNVAFENPRVHRPPPGIAADYSPYKLCPDRITGRSSHAELCMVCPQRTWRLVEVNVPYSETLAHRENVITLMHPHNTEMDLSIAYALYFASRGLGSINEKSEYKSPARILLSGLGADELFGGYQRHGTAFSRKGFLGLAEELDLDITRLPKRNLGRDDRVISDSGREVRFPFIDEEVLNWALAAPVWAKTGFGQDDISVGSSEVLLDAEKRVLRLLASKLGMVRVASEKKRAIQFGARTAKMEAGKIKGTHAIKG
ncbi:asparagine synthase-domain-containing protein [Phyllosticta citriasiana]|uniref:Asparagine synthase-domain-containing protein n=1 Tax=Phyllosticta citriasiana TaxID=595635 RepID=A0ABR1KFQ6_9PEZI